MNIERQRLEQAIEWTANLRDTSSDDQEWQAFEAWLEADPANRQAWDTVQHHLQRTLAPLAERSSLPARHALQAAHPGRRQVLRGALLLAGAGVGATLLSQPGLPLAQLGADLRSRTGQRLQRRLEDGSQLTLDAQSAVDIDFSVNERRITLRAGKLLVQVSHDPRPLTVYTPFGSVRALGTRFMVAQQPTASHVWVLESSVRVDTLSGSQRVLQTGQGARFAHAIEPLAANRQGESSWADGWLNVEDWPLGDVIDALRPYRPGILRLSPQAAELRVSALISLDDSNRALQALEQTLPLRVTRYLDWWTRIELR